MTQHTIDPAPHVVDPETLLMGLDPEQRAVATHRGGPLCVLAGAGTGKTRAITHRIAYGVHSGFYQPNNVLALTYTARAAGEMRSRLRDLGVPGVQARTFHSAALRQLQYFWPKIWGSRVPQLIKGKAQLVAHAAASVRVPTDPAVIRDLAGEIEWAKVSMVPLERYAQIASARGRQPGGLDLTAIARVGAAYEQAKLNHGVMDFEDVLLMTAALMRDHEEVLDAVRRQYRHLVVDEFQDVSPIQHELMTMWLGKNSSLCVVGDAGQTIYSFAGATPEYLTGFTKHHHGAEVIKLIRNYRSTQAVVHLANRVLAGAPAAARASYVSLQAGPNAGTKPKIHTTSDDQEEAQWVAHEVQRLVQNGADPATIAVLFRTNGQSEPFERALTDAHVPYLVRGGERFFARPEVREALVALRSAARSQGEDERIVEVVRAVLVGLGWSQTPPEGTGAVRQKWESLQALMALAETVSADRPGTTVADVVQELDDRAEAQHAPTVQGVTLASLHSTKGLEWDHVFLAGMCEGLMPIGLASSPENIEEERRLLYVGVTRARLSLALSYALSRQPGGRSSRRLSRFLVDHSKYVAESRSRTATPKYRSAERDKTCRVCGTTLETRSEKSVGRCSTCPASYDEAVFERLRQWRLTTAKAASVPAYVVFSDATLTVIAERTPSTLRELADIPGVGQAKLGRYGDDVLEVLAETS